MNSNDIATYLIQHPHFFEEHAELLSAIKLTSPVMGRAISLQERQMEVVREKYRNLELKLTELNRIAEENFQITTKYQEWTRALLMARNDVDLPHILSTGLQEIFDLPHATLRLWSVAPEFQHTWFAENVDEDIRLFARGLNQPYCGKNMEFDAARWIITNEPVESIALLPLRLHEKGQTFGLLVLGSPDASRYTKEMSTDFLLKIADTASAAMACLVHI